MKMKEIISRFSMLLVLFGLVFITSCGEDDPIIDPGGDGINVADGLYLKADGADPVSSAGLVSEVVEANDFASQERTGFNGGYMYLEAGDYNVVAVTNKEITTTIGGVMQVITDDGSSCDFNDYMLVTTEVDGPAFTVANSGLYRVTHDAMTDELILYNISEASIIGSATENGWGADTPLSGSVSADGASWSAAGLILRSGEWKVRFNCRWGVNRRIDPVGSLNDPSNGYQFFTNFGGTVNDLMVGGANIQQMEDGEYTVTVSWSKQDGWSLNAERTGDAPDITFNPNDYRMAVIGDATAGAWDSDQNLFHKEAGGVHTWYGVVTFGDTGEYKFRANDGWDINYGGDLANLSNGGGNIPTPGAGAWYIVLTTADEGATWSAMVTNQGWNIIGAGGPAGSWDMDTAMTADGFANGVSNYSYTGAWAGGEWKFRAAGAWDHNIGGDVTFLTVDGGNINTPAGTYTVTLSYNGETYSATIQ